MKAIKTKREYYSAMAEMEQYLERGFATLTASEEASLSELSAQVQAYEAIPFPMPVKHDIAVLLTAYMQENGMTRRKLAEFLGVGNSTLSEVMNGKRAMTLDFAKKLHKKMHFDGNMILELC